MVPHYQKLTLLLFPNSNLKLLTDRDPVSFPYGFKSPHSIGLMSAPVCRRHLYTHSWRSDPIQALSQFIWWRLSVSDLPRNKKNPPFTYFACAAFQKECATVLEISPL